CEPAWDIAQGEGIVVAVIDTGVDYNHEDIQGNVWHNAYEIPDNGIDDDKNGYIDDIRGWDFAYSDSDPMDGSGHGTHCAGTIAAVGNNGMGIIGVSPKAKIMPLKGLDDNGSGFTADLAKSIRYAAFNGADILSNSWGFPSRVPSDPTLEEAVDDAYAEGCIIVFAAGNENDDVAYYSPQNRPNTIVVAATDYNDMKASFSNWGDEIDVAAPGAEVLSLRATGTDMYLGASGYTAGERFVPAFDKNARYYRANGTSMACPHVAGLAALIRSNYSILTNEEVRQIIRDSADDFRDPGFDIYFGYGRINAYEAALQTPNSYGRMELDRACYPAPSEVGITVLDSDLNSNTEEQDAVAIEIRSTTEATPETILLIEIQPNASIFQGSIPLELSSSPIPDNGTLQVQHNDTITAIYVDESPEGIREATAIVDAQPPIIGSVQVEPEILISGKVVARITWQTDEFSTSKVHYGMSLPLSSSVEVSGYVTDHVVTLTELDMDSTYYFAVESQDTVGNPTYDDNSGSFYQFIAISPEIKVVPLKLHFETLEYATDPLIQMFTILNTAHQSCDLLFEIPQPSQGWITVSAEEGRIEAGGGSIDIEVTVNVSVLGAGLHIGDIIIYDNSSLGNQTVLQVEVNALPVPVIRYHRYQIIDDWSGKSYMCNGDKHFNSGERVELQIEIENLGSLPAKGTSAVLSFATPDPYVTILDDDYNVVDYYTVEWGDIAASTVGIMPNTFLIKANDDAPDYHVVDFALEVTDIDGHIWYEEFQIGLMRWSGISAVSDIQLDRSETYNPKLAQVQMSSDENGNVYVVWTDECNGMTDIYFNYSRDFGVTWQKDDIRLDTDKPGTAGSTGPRISSDGNGNVYVVWEDYRNEKSDIYFNYSHDYGATWLIQDIRLDTDKSEAVYSQRPQIVSDENGNIYVAWRESCDWPDRSLPPGRDEDEGYYFNYSHDFGRTWQAEDIKIDDGWTELFYSYPPRISCDNNGNVYAVWSYTRPTGFVSQMNIFFNCSRDYGVTWGDYVQICTPDGHSGLPRISSDNNGNVYVIWRNDRNKYYDIYFNYSHDFGATWQANEIRLDTDIPVPGEYPHSILHGISSDNNGNIYGSWSDRRNDFQNDVYFNYSHDFGATWQGNDIQIEKEPTQSFTNERSISSDDNGGVYIAWSDRRNGPYEDIYFDYSQDFGITWQSEDIRLDTDPPNDAFSFRPRVSSDNNGNVYVVWLDNRNYNDKSIYPNCYYPADIYFTPINVRAAPELAHINDIWVIQEGKTLEFTITATSFHGSTLEFLFDIKGLPQDLHENMANVNISETIFNEETGETTARFSWIPMKGAAGDYYPVFLIAKDPISDKCTYQAIKITVLPGPPTIANFEAYPRSGDETSLTVNFTDRSTGNIATRFWDFGDGATSIERNPTHTYTSFPAQAAYTVSLAVTGPESFDTETKIDYIKHQPPPPPVADFTALPTAGEAPLSVKFTDLSSGKITSWFWDFGDGATSTEENPSHTYTVPNAYTVSLTVTNLSGSNTETKFNYIGISPYDGVVQGWVHDIKTNKSLEGVEVTLKPYTYEGGARDYTAITDADGNYKIRGMLKYLDSQTWLSYKAYISSVKGYEDYVGEELTFSETKRELKCDISLQPYGMIYGRVYNSVTGKPIKGTTVALLQWGQYLYDTTTTDLDGNYEFTRVNRFSSSSGGGYWIYYKISISEEYYEDYISQDIPFSATVWHIEHDVALVPPPPPVADFTALPAAGDVPLTIEFTDTSSGVIDSWLWDFGDLWTSTERNSTHTYKYVGTYTVSLTVTGPGGQSEKRDYIIVIFRGRIYNAYSDKEVVMPGDTLTLYGEVTGGTFTSYAWLCDDMEFIRGAVPKTQQEIVAISDSVDISWWYFTPGTHTIQLRARNDDLGIDHYSEPFTITVTRDGKTIQDEIDEALPGDTVYIEPGIYKLTSLDLNITKSIKLVSSGPIDTTILLGEHHIIIRYPMRGPGTPPITDPIDVTIEGITIAGHIYTEENPYG
ncbi:MAG: S8 family serine peptidase, partial [Planctomycetota bacterium]